MLEERCSQRPVPGELPTGPHHNWQIQVNQHHRPHLAVPSSRNPHDSGINLHALVGRERLQLVDYAHAPVDQPGHPPPPPLRRRRGQRHGGIPKCGHGPPRSRRRGGGVSSCGRRRGGAVGQRQQEDAFVGAETDIRSVGEKGAGGAGG